MSVNVSDSMWPARHNDQAVALPSTPEHCDCFAKSWIIAEQPPSDIVQQRRAVKAQIPGRLQCGSNGGWSTWQGSARPMGTGTNNRDSAVSTAKLAEEGTHNIAPEGCHLAIGGCTELCPAGVRPRAWGPFPLQHPTQRGALVAVQRQFHTRRHVSSQQAQRPVQELVHGVRSGHGAMRHRAAGSRTCRRQLQPQACGDHRHAEHCA